MAVLSPSPPDKVHPPHPLTPPRAHLHQRGGHILGEGLLGRGALRGGGCGGGGGGITTLHSLVRAGPRAPGTPRHPDS